jgi:hypothetical protein
MPEPSPREEAIAIRRTHQEIIDLLLFISDEIEMGRLPTKDGASAVRMVAGLVALMIKLT